MKSILQFIVMMLTLVIIQPAQAAEEGLDKASLLLQWTPQAQFAGYFMAQEKGFYRQQGIDLTIIPGGPDKVVSDSLATGKVSFGTMFLSTALKRRAAGMPLVNIGQIIQDSTLMLIARTGTGIESIADLDQKKVAIWANEFQIQLRMLFDQEGIEVVVVPQGGTMDLFLYGAASATSGLWYNEYHTI
ncbi:MAG: ABC transporter substrate-binding protein, partial [Proteobacteria bacterium]|nr:ABC transporter substrate-binding protein [Pseudomonadota bacterium]